jgi:hypothetical protein
LSSLELALPEKDLEQFFPAMPPVFPALPSDVRGSAAGVSGYAAGCARLCRRM